MKRGALLAMLASVGLFAAGCPQGPEKPSRPQIDRGPSEMTPVPMDQEPEEQSPANVEVGEEPVVPPLPKETEKTPAGKPGETMPGEKPAEAEKAAEKPAERPAEKPAEPEKPAEKNATGVDRVKRVRATCEHVPPTALGIKEPIVIGSYSTSKVPKTIGLTLYADGTTHQFSWFLDRGFSNAEYDRLYWTHWKGIGKVKHGPSVLGLRGPKEEALYGLLIRWAATQEKKKTLDIVERGQLEFVKGLLDRLDRRFAGEKPEEQKRQ